MSDSSTWKIELALVAGILVFAVLCVLAGYRMGGGFNGEQRRENLRINLEEGRQQIIRQAILKGYAVYTHDEQGMSTWAWKDEVEDEQ